MASSFTYPGGVQSPLECTRSPRHCPCAHSDSRAQGSQVGWVGRNCSHFLTLLPILGCKTLLLLAGVEPKAWKRQETQLPLTGEQSGGLPSCRASLSLSRWSLLYMAGLGGKSEGHSSCSLSPGEKAPKEAKSILIIKSQASLLLVRRGGERSSIPYHVTPSPSCIPQKPICKNTKLKTINSGSTLMNPAHLSKLTSYILSCLLLAC